MTRKRALLAAVRIVESMKIKQEEKKEIIDGLNLCLSELPFSKWSKEAIFDACNQFIEENGKITLNDFKKAELPSHPTIRNRFGMTLAEFCNEYYPDRMQAFIKSPYQNMSRQELTDIFKCEFNRIHPTSRKDYDKRRDKKTPCSTTIMARLNITKWLILLDQCNVIKQQKDPAEEYHITLLAQDKKMFHLIYGKT